MQRHGSGQMPFTGKKIKICFTSGSRYGAGAFTLWAFVAHRSAADAAAAAREENVGKSIALPLQAALKARLGAPGCLPALCFYNFYCSRLLPPSHCQSLPSSPALTQSFDRCEWLEDVNGRERETIHANVCTNRAEGRNPIGMEIKRCSDQKRERRQVAFFVFTVAFACGGLR